MMKAEQKFARALTRLYGQPASDSICSSCQRTLFRRHYASTATATATAPETSPSNPLSQTKDGSKNPKSLPALRPSYQLKAGVVLSRAPLLTRSLSAFEKAFYLYQRRLNERLAMPFTRYFYYKKGTPADGEWKRKIKERLTPARDIGVYDAYGKFGWNDEVLVGARESETEDQVDKLVRDAEAAVQGEGTADVAEEAAEASAKNDDVVRPMPRVSVADKEGDVKSLDRRMDRTLYLLVKGDGGRWMFPSARLLEKENLHQAAERVLTQSAGINMNTWLVGNAPIGHYSFDFPKSVDDSQRGTKDLGEKVFFLKGRIMAGQADLAENKLGLVDFRWAAKEEVEALVTRKYWSMTQDMLAER